MIWPLVILIFVLYMAIGRFIIGFITELEFTYNYDYSSDPEEWFFALIWPLVLGGYLIMSVIPSGLQYLFKKLRPIRFKNFSVYRSGTNLANRLKNRRV